MTYASTMLLTHRHALGCGHRVFDGRTTMLADTAAGPMGQIEGSFCSALFLGFSHSHACCLQHQQLAMVAKSRGNVFGNKVRHTDREETSSPLREIERGTFGVGISVWSVVAGGRIPGMIG